MQLIDLTVNRWGMSDALVEEVEDFLGKGEFSRKKIVKALQRCDNDVDEAVALILDEAGVDKAFFFLFFSLATILLAKSSRSIGWVNNR